MVDDILLNKADILEKCIRRIHEEYQNDSQNLFTHQTKQDSIILNSERS